MVSTPTLALPRRGGGNPLTSAQRFQDFHRVLYVNDLPVAADLALDRERAVRRTRVVDVEEAVLRVLGMEREPEQPLLAAAGDLRG